MEATQSWTGWLQDVAKTGLARKWDSEYLERLNTASQVPTMPPQAQQPLPVLGAPLSPLMIAALALAAGGLLYVALKD